MRNSSIVIGVVAVICLLSAFVWNPDKDRDTTEDNQIAQEEVVEEVGDLGSYDPTADIYAYLSSEQGQDALVHEVPNEKPEETPNKQTTTLQETKTGLSDSTLKDKYDFQKNNNSETIGWLEIDALKISEPIMFSGDNSYYLEHDRDKNYNKNGSVFMDAGLNGEFGKITLLHGHNMKNNKIFGKLDNLLDEELFNSQPVVKIYDGTKERIYIPFSIFHIDANTEQIPLSFTYLTSYQDYYQQLKLRSLFSQEPGFFNNVLLLQTCAYVYTPASGKDGRLVVACYELEG